MLIEVSNGELLDKFSILQLKLNKITDPVKIKNVEKELTVLRPLCEILLKFPNVLEQYNMLFSVNGILWDIEDSIRKKESVKEFDDEFISLARSVYFNNDKRAEIKKTINVITKSELVEEKSYKPY